MNERGITIIEIVVAATIFTMVLGAATMAISQDAQTQRVMLGQLGPEMKARDALQRIVTELRMASIWGEDKNRNGVLDPDEDTNQNGVLDSDWSLKEAGTDATANPDPSFITFNRRTDAIDEAGLVVASGVFSEPVSYRLEADRLVRVWNYTDESGATWTRRAVLANGILGMRFSRTAEVVTISLDVRLPPRVYKTDRRTLTTRVWLRN